ncbi:ureidoglycolate hydrolase [Basidiobolus meristosporus CBS 931.73]|uniref:Ureidoglycolate hydrolase n=1 Tax=Basidiobolus meristosporus CBS 931.73 TaxID=1314790 RepID=A0A1Y1Y626_9FUNG|nr:ureidoglycolate hydrolase [Basidiobolus meristosporus CBS 931.73]|eukprot:ORX93477.1 ureidoglycolate hydrolase [Basidiobolus meristosporus CBS 931.73]
MTQYLTAVPATRENFAAYGDVVCAHDGAFISANQGTAQRYNHVATCTNNRETEQSGVPKANPNLCVFRCKPATQIPFPIKLLERHPYSSQCFIPMATDRPSKGYLVIVALNGKDDRPDLSTMKAFIFARNQGVNYGAGIWHHPMVALEELTDFGCIVWENKVPDHDCNIVDIEGDYKTYVPGYRAASPSAKL